MRSKEISTTHNFGFSKLFCSKTTVNPYQKKPSKIEEMTHFLVLKYYKMAWGGRAWPMTLLKKVRLAPKSHQKILFLS
jgi:hypothetical protein